MALDSFYKADELIRLLGQIGEAQEYGAEVEDLCDQATRLSDELAQEISPRA